MGNCDLFVHAGKAVNAQMTHQKQQQQKESLQINGTTAYKNNENEWARVKREKYVKNEKKKKLMKTKRFLLLLLNAYYSHTRTSEIFGSFLPNTGTTFPSSAKLADQLFVARSFSSRILCHCVLCKVVFFVTFSVYSFDRRSVWSCHVDYMHIAFGQIFCCAISKSIFAFCWHTLRMYTIPHITHTHTTHSTGEWKLYMRLYCSISLVDGENCEDDDVVERWRMLYGLIEMNAKSSQQNWRAFFSLHSVRLSFPSSSCSICVRLHFMSDYIAIKIK